MSIEPIKKRIVVEAPQERAFRVFWENIDGWWPRTHSIGKSPMKTAILEPKSGGRWYEIGEDGAECEWGKVLVFEPPRKLVLAWQIGTTWQYDPALITEVEVIFTADGPKRTVVELEHRYLERLGDAAAAGRGQLDSGWGGLLELYAAKAQSPA